jgi:hypothetical protein
MPKHRPIGRGRGGRLPAGTRLHSQLGSTPKVSNPLERDAGHYPTLREQFGPGGRSGRYPIEKRRTGRYPN